MRKKEKKKVMGTRRVHLSLPQAAADSGSHDCAASGAMGSTTGPPIGGPSPDIDSQYPRSRRGAARGQQNPKAGVSLGSNDMLGNKTQSPGVLPKVRYPRLMLRKVQPNSGVHGQKAGAQQVGTAAKLLDMLGDKMHGRYVQGTDQSRKVCDDEVTLRRQGPETVGFTNRNGPL